MKNLEERTQKYINATFNNLNFITFKKADEDNDFETAAKKMNIKLLDNYEISYNKPDNTRTSVFSYFSEKQNKKIWVVEDVEYDGENLFFNLYYFEKEPTAEKLVKIINIRNFIHKLNICGEYYYCDSCCKKVHWLDAEIKNIEEKINCYENKCCCEND